MSVASTVLLSSLLATALAGDPLQTVKKDIGADTLPRAEVRAFHGVPTLFINGRPHSGLSYMTYRPGRRYFHEFGQAGIHLYSFSATPTESGYGLAPACWVAPGKFDDTGIDSRATMVLDADPEAYFFPRLYLNSPRWWDEQHPDDLVTYDPGDGKPVPFFHGGNRKAAKRVPSWASTVWREDTAKALRRFIRHVEASPYGSRCIGYHLASGTTEEWMQWGSNENQWVDYSKANVRAFRQWLQRRYKSVEKLQAAWKDPGVTFQNARVPSRKERSARELGMFRDPSRGGARGVDYVLYNSWLVADSIRYFAKVVKDATRRRAIVGVFYGYVLQLAGEQREQNAGHLAIEDVLACPDVDFITSPTSYAFRALGSGFSHFMSLTDSVKLHRKLWIDENDIRTWLTRAGKPGDWGKTATFQESLLCQQREFGNVLAQGCGMWWFDMGGGWYDHPGMLAAIRDMGKIGERSLRWDRSPVAEIAFVVDDRSSAYLAIPSGVSNALLVRQLPVIGKVGAPFATIHLADLEKAPPYKLLIFPNAVAPTERERAAIRRAAARPGTVTLFELAPGLIRKSAIQEASMEDLTGIRLRLSKSSAVVSEDNAAKVLAPSPKGGPAVVAKEIAGSTVVFSPGPIRDPGMIRSLARKAGVHLYAPVGDVVWANRSVLTVSVNQGGTREISLPRPATVTELLSGRLAGEGVRSFTWEFRPSETRIFRTEWARPVKK